MMDVCAEAGAHFLISWLWLHKQFTFPVFEQFIFPALEQYDDQRWMGPGFQDEALGHQLV